VESALPSVSELMCGGEVAGQSALTYWESVVKERGHVFTCLLPIASMWLALPSGESCDEFVFSASGRAYTKDRNALSPVRLEQISVIVMYIRNFGWSQHKMMEWFKSAVALVKEAQKSKSAILRT